MTTPASQALRRSFQKIMKSWEERARKEVNSAFGTTSLSLRNALQGHLDQLATALDSSAEKTIEEIAITTTHSIGVGKEHGRDRANTAGYSIEEVIFEYRLFRQVIIQVLEKEIELSGIEREIITDLIEQAVNDAAVQFSDTVRDLSNQYTATLTHDLRGPITAAKASADLILRRPDKAELCVKYSTRIIESLSRMDAMIQNLLDAGRIRAGQALAVMTSECNPTLIIREIIEEMSTVHGGRFLLFSDAEIRTWWSHDLFRRAIENLFSNAIKYGGEKSPITTTIQRVDSSVKIIVHNSGNPIPESEQSSLFQNYRRAKSAEASNEKGWGLGLTLVAGVAQAHGGSITVESSLSEGTSFVMILPKDCRK